MTNRELLSQTDHRPWNLPKGNWKFYQEWNNAIFLHWAVDVDKIRELIPSGLELDLYQGKPWVSLVAFTMEKIRPSILPSFSPISNFNEINIRTYVKANGKSGVYFLSIEAGNRLSSWIARSVSALPYRYSSMARTTGKFTSTNTQFKDKFSIEFAIHERQNAKTELDIWLTERYALFQDDSNGINKFEIHHLEWPVEDIQIGKLSYNYSRFNELLIGDPDLAHWSSGVSVVAWDKKKVLEK